MNTNEFFTPGKLSTILDAQAGSSGKGVIGSFVCAHADNWQFACNAFSAQAGHWVKLDDKRGFFYQTFNSCAYDPDKYEKLYIGADSAIELPALFREKEENNIPSKKIGLSPLATIIQDRDMAFERGEVDFDGNSSKGHDGTMKTGSTCHGVGAARARRMLRRKEVVLAKDLPILKEFICDVPGEIMDRLDAGQAGLMEIAQGFQLSLLGPFYPHVTSRNVTVSAGLDGLMLPPKYAGNVLLNMRTFPIRINSFKFLDPATGKHLTWAQVQEYEKAGKKYTKYEGNSGSWYSDQQETTWEQITKDSQSPTPIMEITSVTKLPRRVATFSKENLRQAIRYNRPPEGHNIYLSVNFMNYIDASMAGVRESDKSNRLDDTCLLTDKCEDWLAENIDPITDEHGDVILRYLGTGPYTDDKIVIDE
jgi:adenylosuccinate synthase